MRFSPLAILALLAVETDAFVPNSILNRAPSRLPMADFNEEANRRARADKARDQLEREISDAEEARAKVLRDIDAAEQRRRRLEREAAQAQRDANDRRRRLNSLDSGASFTAKSAVPAAAGTLGAIALGRTVLQTREQKQIEQEIARQERKLRASQDGGLLGVSYPVVAVRFLGFLGIKI